VINIATSKDTDQRNITGQPAARTGERKATKKTSGGYAVCFPFFVPESFFRSRPPWF